MCGRFSFFIDKEDWTEFTQEELEMQLDLAEDFRNRYNIAPSDDVMTWAPQVEEDRLVFMSWGFVPHYADDRGESLINARDDKVLESNVWKESLRERRCLIPSTGFYEWGEGNGKTPYRFYREGDRPFLLAGLWREWTPKQKQLTFGGGETGPDSVRTNAIITTDANDLVEPVHDRMPVIVEPEDAGVYLEGDVEEAREFLEPAAMEDLDMYAVSKKVNNPANDTPDIVSPADST